MAAFYAERARGGVGLIVTGGFSPNLAGRVYHFGSQLSFPWQVRKHRLITEAVHAADGKIALQILHTGRYAYHPLNVAPSKLRAPINRFTPRALTSGASARPSVTTCAARSWRRRRATTASRSWAPRAT
jgi:2,4-dienoyl-CoA reductase (NADPH2)